jgi:Protein kinase domain
MASDPLGDDEQEARAWTRDVVREIDAILRAGGTPDAESLAAKWPDDADRVRSMVELRTSLFEEGMLEDDGVEEAAPAGPDTLLVPIEQGRDDALADIKREFQDALNRGVRPDVLGIVDERPELKDDVAELSQFYNFLADALKPDFVGPAPEPQEVLLSHFRLIMMHGRHPLGGLFLGIDQHTKRHVELLVIRGQMSKARSTRLLREALRARDSADPGIVPVIDAGEFQDLRFVAWQYRNELTLDRVIRRVRRGGGDRTLIEVLAEHGEPSDVTRVPARPDEEPVPEGSDEAAARLMTDPFHVASVLELVANVAETLDRAHMRGMLLVDVRPANVYVSSRGRPRLRGFGVVQHARAAWHRLGRDVTFLAPEVLADDEPPLDWRADVYGAALTLYAALALKDPPDFSSMTDRTERLFVDLRGAPDALLPLLDRALDRDPAARPASCGVFAEELRKMVAVLRPPRPTPAPPRASSVPVWAWCAVILVLIAAVVVLVFGPFF